MTIELDNNVRRALGLAVQVLEDLPEWLRPESNMDDMRDLLAGKSSGRDGVIVTEAIAIALAWRTREVTESKPHDASNADVHIRRIDEFMGMFALAQHIDAHHFALSYLAMCDRLARSRQEQPAE